MSGEPLIVPASGGKIVPAYFDHNAGCYWALDDQENYIKIRDKDLQLRLRQAGFSKQRQEGIPLSQVETEMLRIQQKQNVAYASPLAGYSKGVHEISGQLILVTTSPVLIEPREGNWPVLGRFLGNLLGDQQQYFDGWIKHGVECLRSGRRAPGQVLVIAGEAGSGKSLLQNLVTLMLGGRSEKPYRYMSGGTPFNSELFRAEHLMIEDEAASTDLRTRKHFGSHLKIMTVNETQSCHAKGRTAVSLNPLWRLSSTLNIEPEHLLILPPLDESLEDKLILLKAAKHKMPMPTNTLAERDRFMGTLKSQLPAYLYHVLKMPIPDDKKSERFGIMHYHDPEIRAAIDTLAPEQRMLEIVDAVIFSDGRPEWFGTSAELQQLLERSKRANELPPLFYFPTAAGTYLGRLAKSDPKRVMKNQTGDGCRWKILPPEH